MAFVKHIAAVAVSNTTYAYDRRYKYLIPPDLDERVSVGVRVIVPFGKGNRKRIGVVIRIDNANELPPNETLSMFKPLRSVVDNESVLTPEMLDLMMWIRETTFCTYFEAFRTLIPVGLSVNFTQKYSLVTDNLPDMNILSQSAADLLSKIQDDIELLDEAKPSDINELVEKNFLIEKDDIVRRKKDETIKMLRLTEKYLSGDLVVNPSEKQRKVIELLEQCTAASVKEVCYICEV